MTEKEKVREQKAWRAKMLRYKRARLTEYSIEGIQNFLWDTQDECENIRWAAQDLNELVEAFDGDEEAAFEFQIAFSDLANEVEQLSSQLEDEYVTENFDTFFTALAKGGGNGLNIIGYDNVEMDFFSLCRFDEELAQSEAAKKIKRLTKDEIISVAGQCFGVLLAYVSVKTKYDYLQATFDILKGENHAILQTIKSIENAWEAANKNEFYDTTELDRLLVDLPARIWLE